jgi:alkylhydroperoxidase family enzyme
MAKGAGVEEDELKRNLGAQSSDSKTQAALSFVKRVVEDRGVVTNDDLADLRSVGFSDAEIVEIIAHIGANIFTNYFNHIAETEIDFPLISTADVAKAA